MSLTQVLDRLQSARRNGSGWTARCPAHNDRNPSLSIHERDGKVLLHCHAGCTTANICDAARIPLRELFRDSAPEARLVATYDYRDEQGALLYQVVRYQPKFFRQRRPDGKSGWIWSLRDVRRVLYRLPEALRAKAILVLEGEKDCEAARKLGLAATCNPGGAGKWRAEYAEILAGKRVAVIADADEPGRNHARQVAESLYRKAASVKVLELPASAGSTGVSAKDLSEWLERGGTREALAELIRNTPEWTPLATPPDSSLQTTTGQAPQHTAQTARRIVLVGAEEFLSRASGEDQPWLVDGLLPAGSQTIWQGRPKVGKSHTLLQLAFDAACGLDVFGHFRVPRPIRAAYVELEEPEAITKERFARMLRAYKGQGPDSGYLRFFTRADLQRLKMSSQELAGAGLADFASALCDAGAQVVFLIAARRFVYGNVKEPEVAERLNDALDLLGQRTGAAIALAHHSRKEPADTLEAQSIGHTFLSAHADATFDISRAADGFRKVGREGRYDEDTFYLRKMSEGDGELIRTAEAPEARPDPRSELRELLMHRIAEGDSVHQAAKATGVPYTTAKRWAAESQRPN